MEGVCWTTDWEVQSAGSLVTQPHGTEDRGPERRGVWNLAPAPGAPTLRLTFLCPAAPGGDVRVKPIASL